MNTIRVVLYLNQFFAGLGAEEYAGVGPGKKAGAVGPGIALQQGLGEGAQVVATVYCGDNYANEQANAIDEILELVSGERPDILSAGPAFTSGRYGLVCGALCARAQEALGIVAVAKVEYEKGKSVAEAALEGARLRLRPILMTSFAFILGCVPLAIASGSGAVSRQVMGTGVIGGMLTASFMAIFLIPMCFYVVEKLGHRGDSAKAHTPAPDPQQMSQKGGEHA